MDHRFQVSLRGVIELLSQHLYSTPGVFVRELLQNAADAIQARRGLEPAHVGQIRIELGAADGATTLRVSDDGIGLTEEEVHEFLATIGASSKREAVEARREEYIGQFGIGLLSCFTVCDQVVVHTRSARPGGRTLEWCGRQDGTYTLREATSALPSPGTQVLLTPRADMAEWFEPERVRGLARHYGSLLPFVIRFAAGGAEERLTLEEPPWRQSYPDADARRTALLAYGADLFGQTFIDCIPLRSEVGGLDGVAFVLEQSPSFHARQRHRVYLKRMLISEQAENLLPDWAFFVRCVINADALRPTAGRESFYEDDALAAARDALGTALRQYWMDLARNDPSGLQALIALHGLSVRALALDDDDFFRMIVGFLPFETTLGQMTLREFRARFEIVRYAPTLDVFRQLARVAAAQNIGVINAAHTYEAALLEKLAFLDETARVESFSANDLSQVFEDVTLDERDASASLLRHAEAALKTFDVEVDVRKFFPADVPALYSLDSAAAFRRASEEAKSVTDELFAGIIDRVVTETSGRSARLSLNLHNPVVRRLVAVTDPAILRRSVEMLYVQALLLGQRPLHQREMQLLNQGLLDLIAAQLEAHAPRGVN
jgi:molecular chaperone HtpG